MNMTDCDKPDLRFIKRFEYTWREYCFHLFKEMKSDKNYIIFSYGELTLPFAIDIEVVFDFEKSNEGMRMQNHIFTEDCVKELCKEMNSWCVVNQEQKTG